MVLLLWLLQIAKVLSLFFFSFSSPPLFFSSGETLPLPGRQYRYPRVLRLTQVKQLIRLLNSSSEKSQENGAETRNGERTIPNGKSSPHCIHVFLFQNIDQFVSSFLFYLSIMFIFQIFSRSSFFNTVYFKLV